MCHECTGEGEESGHRLGCRPIQRLRYQNFPMKQFVASARRQSVLILLDEHMTSQRCSSCGFKEIPEGRTTATCNNGPARTAHAALSRNNVPISRGSGKGFVLSQVNIQNFVSSPSELCRMFDTTLTSEHARSAICRKY